MDGFKNVIGSPDELRTLYREPAKFVQDKVLDRVDEPLARYIAACPFALLATSDADGRTDVSPRGGPPGFVKVLDDRHLVLPDLSGNNLLDSLSNIVANPHAGLLLVMPGQDETVRVEGRAVLTTDPDILCLWDGELRVPKLAIGIELGTIFSHCAKSFRRGRVWDVPSWSELPAAPDLCEMAIEQRDLGEMTVDQLRDVLEQVYTADLEGEKA